MVFVVVMSSCCYHLWRCDERVLNSGVVGAAGAHMTTHSLCAGCIIYMYILSVRLAPRLTRVIAPTVQHTLAHARSCLCWCVWYVCVPVRQAGLSEEELRVTVTAADFAAAAREVKPSVSMKELDYYHSLRAKFSAQANAAKGGGAS